MFDCISHYIGRNGLLFLIGLLTAALINQTREARAPAAQMGHSFGCGDEVRNGVHYLHPNPSRHNKHVKQISNVTDT